MTRQTTLWAAIAVLLMPVVLASCGKRPAARPVAASLAGQPASTGGSTPVASQPPEDPPVKPADPPAHPPADPPANPPGPPPGEPLLQRGWRYGDDLKAFLAKAPASLPVLCGKCHAVPAPDVMMKSEWQRIMLDMRSIQLAAGKPPDEAQMAEIQAYYIQKAPVDFERLPVATNPGSLEFHKEAFGSPKRTDAKVANVNIVDIDGDGRPEVIVCDSGANTVSILRNGGSGWTEEVIATCDAPVHTAVFDADGDGDLDIAVAGCGKMQDTDDPVGYILLLVNNGAKGWEKRELLTGQPRIADVEPADVDGDGRIDLIVGAFGWRKTGYVGWLKNNGTKWELNKIADRSGAIHVPVADMDGDGRPDFVALVGQESESVTLYLNKGSGKFEAKTIFEAGNPLFGSSGLQLVDLDKDGDLDVLFTNGEALSDPCMMSWPWHGVQWLENCGNMVFKYHDIGRCYGPFRAVAADLDGDGDMDIAVAVLFGRWGDPGESGLIWYENDGKMSFTRHDVPSPTNLITLACGDLDGDGIPELVSGRMIFSSASVVGDGLLKWSITKKK